MESTLEEFEPLQVDKASDGTVTKLYSERRRREDGDDCPVHSYNSGRIIYNKAIAEVLS